MELQAQFAFSQKQNTIFWFTRGGRNQCPTMAKDFILAMSMFSNASFCDMSNAVSAPDGYIKGDVHWNALGNSQVTKNFEQNCLP